MTSDREYQRLVEDRREEITARVVQLKAQTQKADACARLQIEKQIDQLAERKSQIRQQLIHMKDAGEKAFADLEAGSKMALTEKKTAIEDAVARLKQ